MEKRFRKPKGWLWGQFNSARGAILRFGRLSRHETPLAHILYIEGLSEYAEKTFELARDFNKMSCNFSVLDRHGQGKSTRHLDDPEKQHSHALEHDIADLIQYCEENIPSHETIVLLGHSTGGLIATLALEQAPELFKAAIITDPLYGFANELVKNKEPFYARLPSNSKLYEKYVPGMGGWLPRNHKKSRLKEGDFSSDPVRNKVHDFWPAMDHDLRAGAPTLGWIIEVCKGIMKTRTPGFAENIAQPILIFTAGEDKLVNNVHTNRIAPRFQNAALHHFSTAQHEILMEQDHIRKPVMTRIHAFLKNLCP
ncbi:MAG: alpha/beta hydrolase [Rhodospirillales bacterium]|nr:alpha/beta hydrolase [Rhodospirillales bacterium]MCB9996668.1 alpha/beta hydrolase [Rhodospirillales bacterium]